MEPDTDHRGGKRPSGHLPDPSYSLSPVAFLAVDQAERPRSIMVLLPGRINVSGLKCDVYAPMDKRYRIVVFCSPC
jgi:hypothetical protein